MDTSETTYRSITTRINRTARRLQELRVRQAVDRHNADLRHEIHEVEADLTRLYEAKRAWHFAAQTAQQQAAPKAPAPRRSAPRLYVVPSPAAVEAAVFGPDAATTHNEEATTVN